MKSLFSCALYTMLLRDILSLQYVLCSKWIELLVVKNDWNWRYFRHYFALYLSTVENTLWVKDGVKLETPYPIIKAHEAQTCNGHGWQMLQHSLVWAHTYNRAHYEFLPSVVMMCGDARVRGRWLLGPYVLRLLSGSLQLVTHRFFVAMSVTENLVHSSTHNVLPILLLPNLWIWHMWNCMYG